MRGVHLADEGMEEACVEAEVLVCPIDHPIRLIFGINDERIGFVVLCPVLDLIDRIPRLRVFVPKQVLIDEVEVASILLVRPWIVIPLPVGLGMGPTEVLLRCSS